jgi:flagellar protein FlaC
MSLETKPRLHKSIYIRFMFLSLGSNTILNIRGGVWIKLKLGKEESSESTQQTDDKVSLKENNEKEEKKNEGQEENNQSESKQESSSESKKDLENIRRVIKVNEDSSQSEEKKEETSTEQKKEDAPSKDDTKNSSSEGSREELEKKRDLLQNIKDFDFQIKKNQEGVESLSQKIDMLTKDLDDLVSLYEIVSEQMNPFVGLSKVTKKRIDALETFTNEIEELKTRMDDVESSIVKGKPSLLKSKSETPDTALKKTDDISTPSEEIDDTKEPDIPDEGNIKDPDDSKRETIEYNNQLDPESISEYDIEKIIGNAFGELIVEQKIDTMINDFLLNLK